MIKLGGFSASNYYNKVKLALLEKAVPFEESLQWPGGDAAVRSNSPLGKIPFLLTEQGALCESQVICDWLEASYPTPALMPTDAFEAAKVRELTVFLELHLELVARRLYPQAFLGVRYPKSCRRRPEKSSSAISRPLVSLRNSALSWLGLPSPWPTVRPLFICR